MTCGHRVRDLLQSRASAVYGLTCAITLVVFLVLVRAHVAKNPLRGDEVDYYGSMQNVLVLGLPLYYAGEVDIAPESVILLSTKYLDGRRFDFYRFRPETGILKETFFALTDGDSRYTYALWHPPLYIYLGSLFLRLVPLTVETSTLLRYFNLVFCAGIFAGMLALSRELYGRRLAPTLALAFALYALNNLSLRGTVLVDYNATLSPCMAVWFAVTWLRGESHSRLHAGLGLLTMLSFATSLGIGAALVAGAFTYALVARRMRLPWYALASIGAGFLAFLVAFLAFCRLQDLPFSQPFLHNFQRAGIQLDWPRLAAQARSAIEYSAGFYSREVGYLPILLGLGLLARLFITGEASRAPKRVLAPIMVLVGFLIQGSLRADAYGFPKYILFVLPLLFVYLAGESVEILFDASTSRFARAAIGLTVAGLLVVQGSISIKALSRPGSSLYFAGEQGITAISRELNALTTPDETVMSPKDIAFHAERKFVQWAGAPQTDVELVRRLIDRRHICYLASNRATLNASSPAVASYLRQTFSIQAQEGDFLLLRALTAQ